MIPATVPTEAVFDRGNHITTCPVHAWDDDGCALVLWQGQLRRAENLSGFKEVRERRQIVGVVPGGGWMTEWRNPGEESFADPVVAWAVYDDGQAVPIDTDSTGEALPLEPSSKNRRTYHPGQVSEGSLLKAPGSAGDR
ncbi:hypothetical protein GCM10010431_72480 [Streptomyces kunmingensis]